MNPGNPFILGITASFKADGKEAARTEVQIERRLLKLDLQRERITFAEYTEMINDLADVERELDLFDYSSDRPN